MAEAPEHAFLSKQFLEIIETFSRSEVYGYTEASRKKFDFACNIQRDWSRPLVGQTLWKHQEGVDKDIRSMVLEPNTDIWAYIVRDNMKNRSLLQEVVQDFRRSVEGNQLFKLKVFLIPQDFDADDENARKVVEKTLKDSVVNDLLFNVVFGRLSSNDVKYFLNAIAGIQGLNIAILHEIATNGFHSFSSLRKKFGVSEGPLRTKVSHLLACGFIWRWRVGWYYASLKGRVFLDLLRKYALEEKQITANQEVCYLFEILGVDIAPEKILTTISYKESLGFIRNYELGDLARLPEFPEKHIKENPNAYEPLRNYLRLVEELNAGKDQWGIDLTAPLQFVLHEDENNPLRSLVR